MRALALENTAMCLNMLTSQFAGGDGDKEKSLRFDIEVTRL